MTVGAELSKDRMSVLGFTFPYERSHITKVKRVPSACPKRTL
jgi:hypothetical protein